MLFRYTSKYLLKLQDTILINTAILSSRTIYSLPNNFQIVEIQSTIFKQVQKDQGKECHTKNYSKISQSIFFSIKLLEDLLYQLSFQLTSRNTREKITSNNEHQRTSRVQKLFVLQPKDYSGIHHSKTKSIHRGLEYILPRYSSASKETVLVNSRTFSPYDSQRILDIPCTNLERA